MTRPDDDDVLTRNVETLIERGGEAPRLADPARARIRAALIAAHRAPAPALTGASWRWLGAGALAAAAAIALWLGLRGHHDGGAPAPAGATLALADGTTVIRRDGATVTVLGPRRLRITGEALVDVVPGHGRFVVETARGRIEVLGTRFVVDGEADQTMAAVVRGEVKLTSDGGEVLLHAGEEGLAIAGRAPTRAPAPRLSHLVSWAATARRQAEGAPDPVHHGTLFARDPIAQAQEFPLPLRALTVDVVVEDQVARVALDQTFHNDAPRDLEGVYRFAIPPDAALQRLAMYVGPKLTEAAVVERMRARRIYEELVYKQVDPALLEWAGTGRLNLRVYPIPAGQDKRLMVAYTQSLPRLYDQWTLAVPLPELDGPAGAVAFDVRIRGCGGCEIASPSHPVEITRDGADAIVRYREQGGRLGDSLVLHVRDPRPGTTVARRTEGGDGYLMLRAPVRLTDEAAAAPRAYRPRTWIVLDDLSASRGALERRAQADVIDALVREIDEEDRIAVLAVDVTSRTLLAPTRALDVDRRALRAALLDEPGDVGATDLAAALGAATAQLGGAAADDATVVYLGDGVVTAGPRTLDALRAAIVGKARFVGVGIGDGPDTATLEGLAAATGGYATTIDLADDVGWRAFDLVAALHTARVTGVSATLVDAAGAPVAATTYLRGAQLADGEELELVARLPASATPVAAELRGVIDGAPWQRRIALDHASSPGERAGDAAGYLPRLWAERHVAALLAAKHEPVAVTPCAGEPCPSVAELREARDERLRKEIVALGKRYFLLSRHTSLLVLENDQMYATYGVVKGAGDTWAPYAMPATIAVPPPSTTVAASVATPVDATLVRAPVALFFASGSGNDWIAGPGVLANSQGSGMGYVVSAVGPGGGGAGSTRGRGAGGEVAGGERPPAVTASDAPVEKDDKAAAVGASGASRIGDLTTGIGTGTGTGTAMAGSASADPGPTAAAGPASASVDPVSRPAPMTAPVAVATPAPSASAADLDRGATLGHASAQGKAAAPVASPVASKGDAASEPVEQPVGRGPVTITVGGTAGRDEAIGFGQLGTRSSGSGYGRGAYHSDGGYGGLAVQRLGYPGDPLYDDVTEFVPALVAGPLEAWQARLPRAAGGGAAKVSAEARALIEAARARLPSGVYRWGDAEVAVDGQRRLGWRLTTELGLDEAAGYDGTTLTRRYAELGLDVTRAVGDDAAALGLAELPVWLAAPERWAAGLEITAPRPRELVIASAEHGKAVVRLVIALDDQARVTAIRDGAGAGLATVTWRGDAPVAATVGGRAIEVGFTGQAIGDAVAWALEGTTPGVVVELPLRTAAAWRAELPAGGDQAVAGGPAWRRVQRQLMATGAATGDRAGVAAALRALATHGGLALGDVALGGAGLGLLDARELAAALATVPAATAVAGARGDVGRPAVVAYAIAGRALARAGHPASPASRSGLIGGLWTLREAVAALATDQPRVAAARALALDPRATTLRLVAAAAIGARWDLPATELRRVWDAVAIGALRNVAHAQAAVALAQRGDGEAATEEWALALGELDPGAAPPVGVAMAPGVVGASRRGPAGWRLMWARWQGKALASGDYDQVVALVPAALGEVTPILDRAAALAVGDPDRLAALAELALIHGQAPWAMATLATAIAAAPSARLHRLAAVAARQAGAPAAVLEHLEAAQALAGDGPVPVARLRAELGELIAVAREAALGSAGAAREAAVGRALRWGARWRALDPGNAAVDQALGELLIAVGRPEEAWRQLSTVIERDPMAGEGYATVAAVFEGQGKVEEALPFWQQSIILDQTNPTPRLRKAQALIALGRAAEGEALLKEIGGRRWHPRWEGVVWQAAEMRRRGR